MFLKAIRNWIKSKRPKHTNVDGRISLIMESNNIDLVLDIGANFGQTAEKLRKMVYTGKIISFEPVRQCYDVLIKKSETDKNWEIYDMVAVSDKIGKTEINVMENTDMSSLLKPSKLMEKAIPNSGKSNKQTISTTTLDYVVSKYSKKYKNIYVKIDTQGFEYNILKASKTALKKIKGLQLEMSLFPNYDGEKTFEHIIPILQKNGFEAYLIESMTFTRKLNRQMQIEYLGLRK